MEIKARIVVATHKEFPMPKDDILYLPVLVGAEKNYKNYMSYQRDDQGENISCKNPNYNELTAMYWAWKNLKSIDAIGLVHYRRYFSIGHKRSLAGVLSQAQLEHLLKNADVVVPKRRKYYIETNYSHYIHAHHREPLDKTREIIKDYYPSYLKDFDLIMSRRSAHMFNMCVMKKCIFNSYCEWLFDILRRLEKEISISGYSAQESRVYGYVSELLMDVWISNRHVNYVEVPWIQLGKRHLFKKTINFLTRKFNFGSKVTHY